MNIIAFDQQLSAHFSNFVANNPLLATLFIAVGVYFVYLVPLLLIYSWFKVSRLDSLRAVLAGLLAWEGLSKLVAGMVDRARPSFSQIGAKELVFHRPDTSFPSDHSAFLMAVAISFYLFNQRKLGNLVLVVAILVGIARVGIGVHFPGDILGGWLVGAIVAGVIYAVRRPLDHYILEPLIKIAGKVRL